MRQDEAFNHFHEALKLDPDEVDFARTFPDEVRDALGSADIVVDYSFLQGSLSRGTMYSPMKDIDMVICLDRASHNAFLTADDGPAMAAEAIESALREKLSPRYPYLTIDDRSRHAVNLDLGGALPSFDIVPAFEEIEDQPGNVLIADFDESSWLWSNPRELQRVIAQRNQDTSGVFIHIVRMLKHAAKTQVSDEFPGLVAETLVFRSVTSNCSYARGCGDAISRAAQLLRSGPLLEPTGRDDVGCRLDSLGIREAAIDWFTHSEVTAQRALRLDDEGLDEESVALWFSIFGSPFPAPTTEDDEKSAARALAFGPAATRPTRAWRSL